MTTATTPNGCVAEQDLVRKFDQSDINVDEAITASHDVDNNSFATSGLSESGGVNSNCTGDKAALKTEEEEMNVENAMLASDTNTNSSITVNSDNDNEITPKSPSKKINSNNNNNNNKNNNNNSAAHDGHGINIAASLQSVTPSLRPISPYNHEISKYKESTTHTNTKIIKGDRQLRIMQYNIHGNHDVHDKYDLVSIVKVIEREQPDIVSLQEVNYLCTLDMHGNTLPYPVDTPKELENYFKGYTCTYYSSTERYGGEQGVAILSRLPVLEMKLLEYQSWRLHANALFSEKQKMSCLAVRIAVPGWSLPTWFICTHLGCDASGTEQLAELKETIEFIHTKMLAKPDLDLTADRIESRSLPPISSSHSTPSLSKVSHKVTEAPSSISLSPSLQNTFSSDGDMTGDMTIQAANAITISSEINTTSTTSVTDETGKQTTTLQLSVGENTVKVRTTSTPNIVMGGMLNADSFSTKNITPDNVSSKSCSETDNSSHSYQKDKNIDNDHNLWREPCHVIISGDFNITTLYKAYTYITSHGFEDSWVTADETIDTTSSWFFSGCTFSSLNPIVRIDYVMYRTYHNYHTSKIVQKAYHRQRQLVHERNKMVSERNLILKQHKEAREWLKEKAKKATICVNSNQNQNSNDSNKNNNNYSSDHSDNKSSKTEDKWAQLDNDVVVDDDNNNANDVVDYHNMIDLPDADLADTQTQQELEKAKLILQQELEEDLALEQAIRIPIEITVNAELNNQLMKRLECRLCKVIGTTASDHRPVVSVLEEVEKSPYTDDIARRKFGNLIANHVWDML